MNELMIKDPNKYGIKQCDNHATVNGCTALIAIEMEYCKKCDPDGTPPEWVPPYYPPAVALDLKKMAKRRAMETRPYHLTEAEKVLVMENQHQNSRIIIHLIRKKFGWIRKTSSINMHRARMAKQLNK